MERKKLRTLRNTTKFYCIVALLIITTTLGFYIHCLIIDQLEIAGYVFMFGLTLTNTMLAFTNALRTRYNYKLYELAITDSDVKNS